MGEGEETCNRTHQKSPSKEPITDVVGTVNREKNNGLRPLLKDLDFFPAWDLIDFEDYDVAVSKKKRMAYLLPIRGCPNYCTYCSNPVWKLEKPWIRQRTPKNIAEEINYLYGRGIREIYIRSDTFNVDIKWCLEVLSEIEKLKLKGMTFQCNLRADKLNDELAQKLHDVHVWLVHIGLESANDRVLKGIGKNASQADNVRTLELLKKVRHQSLRLPHALQRLGNQRQTRIRNPRRSQQHPRIRQSLPPRQPHRVHHLGQSLTQSSAPNSTTSPKNTASQPTT